jgi:hypothetical protein
MEAGFRVWKDVTSHAGRYQQQNADTLVEAAGLGETNVKLNMQL